MIVALLLLVGVPAWLAIILTVLVGALIGILNGAIASLFKVHSFVGYTGYVNHIEGICSSRIWWVSHFD